MGDTISTYVYLEEFDIYVDVETGYDFQPEEPEDRTIRGYSLGYPGCPAQVENIYDVTPSSGDPEIDKWFNDQYEGNDLFRIMVGNQIEEKIWEEKENGYE